MSTATISQNTTSATVHAYQRLQRSMRFLIVTLIALGWTVPAQAQTYTISPSPFLVALDNSGNIINGACIWTYVAGSSTPATTYTSSSGTANTNPIIADSAGRFTAYLQPGSSYKFVYESACTPPSHGSTLRTADNIAAVPVSGLNVDETGTVGESVSAGDLLYLSDGSNSLNAGQWYRADADLYYASIHPRLGFAVSAITSGNSGTIRTAGVITGLTSLTPGAIYYVSGTTGGVTTTAPANARVVGQAPSATTISIDIGPGWFLDSGAALETSDGRLTLTSGTPVTTSDVTGATSVYYTPYVGNRIALFDGNKWKGYAFSELTLALGTLSSGLPYDVFVYDNAGTLTLEATAWTNGTTRATALVRQNGVYVKTGALTRRYLGTFYTTSTTQTEDSLTKRFLWNMYHRVLRPLRRLESTATWTYSTATLREARASTDNRLQVIAGVAEEAIDITVVATGRNDGAGVQLTVGIGEDSTSARATGNLASGVSSPVANYRIVLMSRLHTIIPVGFHFYTWLEASQASGTSTWEGADAPYSQSGITGMTRM